MTPRPRFSFSFFLFGFAFGGGGAAAGSTAGSTATDSYRPRPFFFVVGRRGCVLDLADPGRACEGVVNVNRAKLLTSSSFSPENDELTNYSSLLDEL